MGFINFFPSQIALILGTQQRDILEWVMDGALKASRLGKAIVINTKDLAEFLAHHPIYVGRIYCEDGIPFYNDIRRQIVDQMEAIRSAAQCNTSFGMH